MVRDKTFLIGIDGSDSSIRSISYVAEMVGTRENFHIVLFHILPPIPPELLEFGGAEDPATEQKLDETLKKEQAQWIDNAKKTAEPILENAKTILYQLGVSPARITTLLSQTIHRPNIARELLETAHKQNCGTIVVGRESYSTFKEMFHHHVGEELAQKGQGFAVWVIA
ncbi:MAG: universal stress protein [Nitrospirales bacterium]|nr:universal stress protein [Nitrospirales bacterium]